MDGPQRLIIAQNHDQIYRLFRDLRNGDEIVKTKAAKELCDLVMSLSCEWTEERFDAFCETLMSRISMLIGTSSTTSDKLSGILALDCLIDCEAIDGMHKTIKFSSQLRIALKSDDFAVSNAASKTFGHLIRSGGAYTAELVEAEVIAALERLESGNKDKRRLSAVLLIGEIARNSPTFIYASLPQAFNSLWNAVRDPQIIVRQKAAEAIGACIDVMALRDETKVGDWCQRAWVQVFNGYRGNSHTCHLHGSLLILKELLKHRNTVLHNHYSTACEWVLGFKDHRNKDIRVLVIQLVPILASHSLPSFINQELHKFMDHSLSQLKLGLERDYVFDMLGSLAKLVGVAIIPYLDDIFLHIRYGLELKTNNHNNHTDVSINTDPIFRCIGMLTCAIGPATTQNVEKLLDLIFACGLGEQMEGALRNIVCHISSLRLTVQENLLHLLSLNLLQTLYRPLGCPNGMVVAPSWSRKMCELTSFTHDQKLSVALTLQTLGSFDFSGHILNKFACDVTLRYLGHTDPKIRRAAAIMCCQRLAQDPILQQTSMHAIKFVNGMVHALLTVAVGDPEPSIRKAVLDAMKDTFERNLAAQDNLHSLFLAVQDESFAVREAATRLIGRLTMSNPAYVLPMVRKMLIQLLLILRLTNTARKKEEVVQLLSLLATNATSLAVVYLESIVDALLPLVKDSNSGLAATTMRALGELARLDDVCMQRYIPKIMSIIPDAWRDSGSRNRLIAAMDMLSAVAVNTGYVIDPYLQHPTLLPMILEIIRTEPHEEIRTRAIRLIGVLGVLDPFKVQQITLCSEAEQGRGDDNTERSKDKSPSETGMDLMIQGCTPSSEEYYPIVVFNALLHTIQSSHTLPHHRMIAADAIITIFRTMGTKCVPFLSQVMPAFISVMKTSTQSGIEQCLNKLCELVGIVKQHARCQVGALVEVIEKYWNISRRIQSIILLLVRILTKSLAAEFKPHLLRLVPLMIQTLHENVEPDHETSLRVLTTIATFGFSADDYMPLLVPAIMKIFTEHSIPFNVRQAAIETLTILAQHVNLSDFASAIIHPAATVIASSTKSLDKKTEDFLRIAALDCVCAVGYQLDYNFRIYLPTMQRSMITGAISYDRFDQLVKALNDGVTLPQDLLTAQTTVQYVQGNDEANETTVQNKLSVNQQRLKTVWDTTDKSTREDWQEWMNRLFLELLKESPSPALRACSALAGVNSRFAKSLFNSAFASCWAELDDQHQENFIHYIEAAMTSRALPSDILQTLLTLAEFMERNEKALPIDIRNLARLAMECHAFAKALHYKELEFEQDQNSQNVEALVSLNTQLQQPDAAIGILNRVAQHGSVKVKEAWLEKLERWNDALAAYQIRDDTQDFDVFMGKMRCFHALGEWRALSDIVRERWDDASIEQQKSMSALSAAAAWVQGEWTLMDRYVGVMTEISSDRAFFGAILAIQRAQYDEARNCIAQARASLIVEVTTMVAESYRCAHEAFVRIQILEELEETVTYKLSESRPMHQRRLQEVWNRRLSGCGNDIEVWQRLLKGRTLVLAPGDDPETWIKFSSLCRKANKVTMADEVLKSLEIGGGGRELAHSPYVMYARLKLNHTMGDCAHTVASLKLFATKLSAEHEILLRGLQENPTKHSLTEDKVEFKTVMPQTEKNALDRTSKLLSKCFSRLANWQIHSLKGDWTSASVSDTVQEILGSYSEAIKYNKSYHKTWRRFALANFDLINSIMERSGSVSEQHVVDYIVPAICSFFKSMALSDSIYLQDTLRLLTLWFKHGGASDIDTAMRAGFESVSVDRWLEVIPQLIAHINHPNDKVRSAVHKLLIMIGGAHPQSLVYPLTVAMKSAVTDRASAALKIMDKIRFQQPILVAQVEIVSQELIRVAVIWHELWFEALEEASRLYFTVHNVSGMFEILQPLHRLLDRKPETPSEVSFKQAFGQNLADAQSFCTAYQQSGDVEELNRAWNIYYSVYRRIQKQLPQMKALDLSHVSPHLKDIQDLDLAVPGTYFPRGPLIGISRFVQHCIVMDSKQRPRRITMLGSNGQKYDFLLKGHEDIRQDERVMQLFGLCNTLLDRDQDCHRRHLKIQCFSVIPLSQNSGLSGWVQESDTLHALIKGYRESRHILLNIEQRIMLQMAPDYESLTLPQKVEVFGYAMDNTTGKDLSRILWLKSRSSEAWLERRTNYTRSIAVMSMVGYMLGLGDRHPSNLMLSRETGSIIHIDFGDCFEVALHRPHYPERVPFRLTRMMTFAMGVANVEGSFRITCEHVMRIIRANKGSLLAVLEAFIYDPLLSWRLNSQQSSAPDDFQGSPMDGLVSHTIKHSQAKSPPRHSLRRSSILDPAMVGGSIEDARSLLQNARTSSTVTPLETKAEQNERALQVLDRVKQKLMGQDLGGTDTKLSVPEQVNLLILQATSVENLCQHWVGWCPFW